MGLVPAFVISQVLAFGIAAWIGNRGWGVIAMLAWPALALAGTVAVVWWYG